MSNPAPLGCIICHVNGISTALNHHGNISHMCVCESCANTLQQNQHRCPICRADIISTTRVYVDGIAPYIDQASQSIDLTNSHDYYQTTIYQPGTRWIFSALNHTLCNSIVTISIPPNSTESKILIKFDNGMEINCRESDLQELGTSDRLEDYGILDRPFW